MTQFSEAEEAFIAAAIPVIEAGERQRVAFQEFAQAEEHASQVGEGLGESATDVEYVHNLMIEAATRAGFGADSEVVAGLNAGLAEYQSFMALVESAQAEAAADGLVI